VPLTFRCGFTQFVSDAGAAQNLGLHSLFHWKTGHHRVCAQKVGTFCGLMSHTGDCGDNA
jgi:hypothetical protein